MVKSRMVAYNLKINSRLGQGPNEQELGALCMHRWGEGEGWFLIAYCDGGYKMKGFTKITFTL